MKKSPITSDALFFGDLWAYIFSGHYFTCPSTAYLTATMQLTFITIANCLSTCIFRQGLYNICILVYAWNHHQCHHI